MDALTLILFLAGLGLLVLGAELLVRGASRLAALASVPPLIVGLTVVAYGTSAPELAVSVGAALAGKGGLAVGNVVGSNIFNILAILGVSALVAPLAISRDIMRADLPILFAITMLAALLCLDGNVGLLDGLLLLEVFVVYTVFLVRKGRRQGRSSTRPATGRGGLLMQLVLVVAGLGLLVLGAHWLVGGAVAMARACGVSDVVIGLTVVAAGTSLPELATSVVATIRGQRDIAVGNVVGSSIFNLVAVLGLSAVSARDGVAVAPELLAVDLPVMCAVTFACIPVFLSGGAVNRWEGVLFLALYGFYTGHAVLAGLAHPALSAYQRVMLLGVAPLAGMLLLVGAARAMAPPPLHRKS